MNECPLRYQLYAKRQLIEPHRILRRYFEWEKRLPEQVDASTLENYRSFKRIENEGKYLFDWVDLFYASTLIEIQQLTYIPNLPETATMPIPPLIWNTL